MNQKTIAILTIGQTPRRDITQDLRRFLPEEIHLTEYGALDGLTAEQAEELFGYRGRGELLITRIGSQGRMITVSGERIMSHMQTCIDRAETDGAQLLLMACTGIFPDYRHRVPLLLPGAGQRVHTLERAAGRPVGVVIPNLSQQGQIARWWKASGAQTTLLEAADPFGASGQVLQAALRLKEAGARVLCLDCFGYTAAQREAVAQATGLETVLPRAVLCQMAQRLLFNSEVRCGI